MTLYGKKEVVPVEEKEIVITNPADLALDAMKKRIRKEVPELRRALQTEFEKNGTVTINLYEIVRKLLPHYYLEEMTQSANCPRYTK